MRYRFVTADVFTDEPFGGNPLAVLPDARGLDDGVMQKIAREFNLSETVFVLPPEAPGHSRRLRIFTPTTEVPFAGHPTVGTALVLAWLGEVPLEETTRIVFEEGAGPVPVTASAPHGQAVFAQLSAPQAPALLAERPATLIASALSLMPSDLVAEQGLPRVVSCGLPFLLVRLSDRQALARARLSRSVWARHLAGTPAAHLFLFTLDEDAGAGDYAVQARMFAPGGGVDEDPATGSAAAALGGWLGSISPLADGTLSCRIAQGIEMGRPSRLEVEVDMRAGAIEAVRVGGAAVLISEGTIEAPATGTAAGKEVPRTAAAPAAVAEAAT